MRITTCLGLAAFGSLAACGGGGGGGGGGGLVSTPAPPSAPAPTNTLINDLKASQSFDANSASSTVALNLTSKTAVNGSGSNGALSISYDAATRSYTVAAPGRSQVFSATDIQPTTNPGEVRYMTTAAGARQYLTLVTTPYTGTVANKYVGLGYAQRNVLTGDRQDTLFDTFTYGFGTPAAAAPRTGRASFDIDVFGLTTTPGFEPSVFQGAGTFDTDFLAGIFSTHASFTEIGLVTGSGVVGGGIEMSGAGKLSGTGSGFTGNVVFGGRNVTLGGSLTGGFYGPAAEELGASFIASNADGSTATGSFTGQRDATNPAVNLTLTNLVTPQLFYSQEALLTVNSFDGETRIVPGTMRLISQLNLQTSDNLTYGPGISSLPGGAFTTASIVAGPDANFTTYEKSFNGQTVRLELYKPGGANKELALTYASFGRWSGGSKNGVVTETDRVYFAYGLETPKGLLSARTGSASYAGVVYGAGANAQTKARYDVSGTSRFDVDFSNQKYTGALALKGTGTNGAAAVDFGRYDFAGQIAVTTAESAASLTQAGAVAGSLSTRFYGPEGEELAGPFTLITQAGSAGAGTTIAGVTVAKRQ